MTRSSPLPTDSRNREDCLRHAMDQAGRCVPSRTFALRLFASVLQILLREHKAMGAYEILEILNADGRGAQAGKLHAPAFLICRSCDLVLETGHSEAFPTRTASGASRLRRQRLKQKANARNAKRWRPHSEYEYRAVACPRPERSARRRNGAGSGLWILRKARLSRSSVRTDLERPPWCAA